MLTAIQKTIEHLTQTRQDRKRWVQFGYHSVETKQGVIDSHARDRLQVLIALQYQSIDADEELIRYLFQQEIVSREEDSFQGYDEALELAAYLLARFKRLSDIWMFADAKRANFDTLCGFSAAFFLFCGQRAAIDYLVDSEHEAKSFVLEYLLDEDQKPRYDQSEVDDEWQRLEMRFPRNPDNEPPTVWIDRAIALGAIQEGRELLGEHETQHPETRRDNSYMWELLGDYRRAIESKKLKTADATEPWDRVFAAKSLAQLYLKNHQPLPAWELIHNCDSLLNEIEGWHECGLGRSLVETAFEVTTALDDQATMRQDLYQWTCQRFDELDRAHLLLLQKAVDAAISMDDRDRAKRFQRLADQEQRNIDQMLGR